MKEIAFVSLLPPAAGALNSLAGDTRLISVFCVCICSFVLGPNTFTALSHLGNDRSLV